MSRFLMLALATVAVSLSACGNDKKTENNQPPVGRPLNKAEYPNIAQTAYGQWQAPDELDNGVFFSTKVFVNSSSFGVEVICRRGPDLAMTSFAVKARVTGNTIEVLERAKSSKKVGELTCTGEISPMQFGYLINGNVLTLEAGNKNQLRLNRVL